MKSFFIKTQTLLPGLLLSLTVLFTFFGCLGIEFGNGVERRWVSAESGLRIRKGPGRDFTPVETMPPGAEVQTLGAASGTTTIDGKRGRWFRVLYRDRAGYAFGGFLSTAPVAGPERHPASGRALRQKARPYPAPGRAGPAETAAEKNTLPELAYAVHDSPSLIKLSLKDFQAGRARLRHRFGYRREAFRKCAGEKGEDETVEAYLKRSGAAKRAFLKKIRETEYAAATRTYSIYDAKLALGGYHPFLHRFDYLGTSLELDSPVEVATVPDTDLDFRRFENGEVQNVKLPARTAKRLREDPGSFLVRIDFSYTVVLQDIVDWTSRAYFLPRYLMVYNRHTGEICYECAMSYRIERGSSLAAPLRITGHFLYERIH